MSILAATVLRGLILRPINPLSKRVYKVNVDNQHRKEFPSEGTATIRFDGRSSVAEDYLDPRDSTRGAIRRLVVLTDGRSRFRVNYKQTRIRQGQYL